MVLVELGHCGLALARRALEPLWVPMHYWEGAASGRLSGSPFAQGELLAAKESQGRYAFRVEDLGRIGFGTELG
jgi:hypothetical protein